jgi:competence protein ComEA
MRKIKFWIRRYFGFSQGEVNGFLVLIILMVLLTAAPFLFKKVLLPDDRSVSSTDQQLLDSLVAQLELKQPAPAERKFGVPTIALRPFNPNTLTVEEWQAFGMPKYLAQRIINYRTKVSDFTYKAELSKIYGLPDSVYQKLYPFISLPEGKSAKEKEIKGYARNSPTPKTTWESTPYRKERYILAPFNINTADTTQLKQIRGIGSKFSSRIIKFRDGLGGFNSINQVQEVYGLTAEIIDSLHKYTYISKGYIPDRVSLNQATSEELKAHPYISSNVARAIVAYREQHGRFEKTEDLLKIKLITPDLYNKLQPYLAL